MQDVIRTSVSVRTICQQSHRGVGGYSSRAAVHKPLITKMNALESSVVQKPQALFYRDVEKTDTVRWVILHRVHVKWASTCVSQRDVQFWSLQWGDVVGGHFVGMVWVHLFPLGWRVTAHLCPVRSGPHRARESLNGLMKMMWIMCYGLCSHQISAQLNTYGRFWSNTVKNGVHHFDRV